MTKEIWEIKDQLVKRDQTVIKDLSDRQDPRDHQEIKDLKVLLCFYYESKYNMARVTILMIPLTFLKKIGWVCR